MEQTKQPMVISMPSASNPLVILILFAGIVAAVYFLWPKLKSDAAKADAAKKSGEFEGMMADMFYAALPHSWYSKAWGLSAAEKNNLIEMGKDCRSNADYQSVCDQYQALYGELLPKAITEALGSAAMYKKFVKKIPG